MRASTVLEFPVPCGGDADSRQGLGERRRAPPVARSRLALYRKGVYNARRLERMTGSATQSLRACRHGHGQSLIVSEEAGNGADFNRRR